MRLDRINRQHERARDDRSDLDAVLDAGHHVGTLSTIADGRPWVVPMLSAYGPPQTSAHATPGLPVSPSVTEFLRG
jgi:uncharacterized protein